LASTRSSISDVTSFEKPSLRPHAGGLDRLEVQQNMQTNPETPNASGATSISPGLLLNGPLARDNAVSGGLRQAHPGKAAPRWSRPTGSERRDRERRVFDPHQGVLDRTPPPARRDPIRSVRMTAGNDDSGRFCHIRRDNAKFMRPLLHVAVERSISLAFCVAKTRGHKVIP
jgi:hypothetical protein